MSDKDVTRNVRASGEEGIATPQQKHFHIAEKGNLPYGKNAGKHSAEREQLLARFRERERGTKEPGPAAETPAEKAAEGAGRQDETERDQGDAS